MRFFNADALIKVQMYDEEHEEWSVETMTVEDCLARFADVPTIIETDRPQGEWIDWLGKGNEWECSVCRCSIESHGSIAYKFCPMCGARMKGVDDEAD